MLHDKEVSTVDKMAIFKDILGAEITIPTKPVLLSHDFIGIEIVSQDLHDKIAGYFSASTPLFKASIPLDKLVRYKDGGFSSMVKSIHGGIEGHKGFAIINGLDIAQDIISHIVPSFNQKLIGIYSDLINQNNFNQNQFLNQFVVPDVCRLKAIADFVKEISGDISNISKSKALTIATLGNVQKNRIELNSMFYKFIEQLNQSIVSPFLDLNAIEHNYDIVKHAASYYIVSLIIEYVLSGNLDEDGSNKMKGKVEACFNKINEITTKLYNIIQGKINNNSFTINQSSLLWSVLDYANQMNVNGLLIQNNALINIQNKKLSCFNVSEEMERLGLFFNTRYQLLDNVHIVDSLE